LEYLGVDGRIILKWIEEIGCEGVEDWIRLVLDKDQRRFP
jgi:hypothetical protein